MDICMPPRLVVERMRYGNSLRREKQWDWDLQYADPGSSGSMRLPGLQDA